MADRCERCRREVWRASTPQHFDAALHCLAHSGARHQLQACAAKELARSRILLDRYRVLATAVDELFEQISDSGYRVHGVFNIDDVNEARAAVREIEEGK